MPSTVLIIFINSSNSGSIVFGGSTLFNFLKVWLLSIPMGIKSSERPESSNFRRPIATVSGFNFWGIVISERIGLTGKVMLAIGVVGGFVIGWVGIIGEVITGRGTGIEVLFTGFGISGMAIVLLMGGVIVLLMGGVVLLMGGVIVLLMGGVIVLLMGGVVLLMGGVVLLRGGVIVLLMGGVVLLRGGVIVLLMGGVVLLMGGVVLLMGGVIVLLIVAIVLLLTGLS